MNQKQENYFTMARTAIKVLDNNNSIWSGNVPFSAIKAKLDDAVAGINANQQGGGAISTGATVDKEMAGDAAIEIAVRLAGLGQVYAAEANNNQLYDQLKVSYTSLDRLQDNVLGAALQLIHKTLTDIGADAVPFGVTPAALTELNDAINNFESINNKPRVIIAERKGHNESIPVLLRTLRHGFNKVDKLIKIWQSSNPKFIADYENARIVIDLGTRHRVKEAPANGDQ